MRDLPGQVADRLAKASSRRGFLGWAMKLSIAAAAAVAGVTVGAQNTFADPECCCCTPCANNYCPGGTTICYTWYCCLPDNEMYACNDCGAPNGSGGCKTITCTYAVKQRYACTPSPALSAHVR